MHLQEKILSDDGESDCGEESDEGGENNCVNKGENKGSGSLR